VRIAIFSDVHANLEALNAVLREILHRKPDRILFLGDAVGYGPEPDECVERIFQVADRIVAGNHDQAVAGLTDIDCFNPEARQAVLWTRSELKSENLRRLSAPPLTAQEESLFLVHATPRHPEAWSYLASAGTVQSQFSAFGDPICLVGHTHRPAVFRNDGKQLLSPKESLLTFQENFRYIVNVGSVGQPRDRNPDAAYALYDTRARTFLLRRVPYRYSVTQEKMRAAHLPSFLVDRLAWGI